MTAASRSDPGTALATLQRGVAFLATAADRGWLAEPWPVGTAGMARARLLSNWLKELDCFLHGVLDEVQEVGPGSPRGAHGSVIHRLGHVAGRDAGTRAQQGRLLALQRSRYTFWHYEGFIRRPDVPGGRWLTSGWPTLGSTRLRQFPLGDRLAFDGAALIDICGFYERVGTGISVRTARARPRQGPSAPIYPASQDDFAPNRPYIMGIAATSIVAGRD